MNSPELVFDRSHLRSTVLRDRLELGRRLGFRVKALVGEMFP